MIETGNRFFVGIRGDRIRFLRRVPAELEQVDAINLAAWIVALLTPENRETFEQTLAELERHV